jgi:hypothetical protein
LWDVSLNCFVLTSSTCIFVGSLVGFLHFHSFNFHSCWKSCRIASGSRL